MNDLCGVCDGSGEGAYDGASCHFCYGTGNYSAREKRKALQEIIADAEYDRMKDDGEI